MRKRQACSLAGNHCQGVKGRIAWEGGNAGAMAALIIFLYSRCGSNCNENRTAESRARHRRRRTDGAGGKGGGVKRSQTRRAKASPRSAQASTPALAAPAFGPKVDASRVSSRAGSPATVAVRRAADPRSASGRPAHTVWRAECPCGAAVFSPPPACDRSPRASPQNPPPAASHACSAAVLSRPSAAFRCGNRPKRWITTRCRQA